MTVTVDVDPMPHHNGVLAYLRFTPARWTLDEAPETFSAWLNFWSGYRTPLPTMSGTWASQLMPYVSGLYSTRSCLVPHGPAVTSARVVYGSR